MHIQHNLVMKWHHMCKGKTSTFLIKAVVLQVVPDSCFWWLHHIWMCPNCHPFISYQLFTSVLLVRFAEFCHILTVYEYAYLNNSADRSVSLTKLLVIFSKYLWVNRIDWFFSDASQQHCCFLRISFSAPVSTGSQFAYICFHVFTVCFW